jgi:hypothetical protein
MSFCSFPQQFLFLDDADVDDTVALALLG